MNRPLLITDCDEVLLHMVAHFDDWLDEAHGIDFAFESGSFGDAMTRKDSGEPVPTEQVWPLLGRGRIEPVIHATFPLERAADAHRLMESSRHIGKIVLVVD